MQSQGGPRRSRRALTCGALGLAALSLAALCWASPAAARTVPCCHGGDHNGPVVHLFVDLTEPASRGAWTRYAAAVARRRTMTLVVHPVPLARNKHARAVAAALVDARAQGKGSAFVAAWVRSKQRGLAGLTLVRHGLGLRSVVGPQASAQVEAERQAAVRLGVRAVPSALLVGRGVAGVPQPRLLDLALAEAGDRWRACQKLEHQLACPVCDCAGAEVQRAGGAPALRALQALRRATYGPLSPSADAATPAGPAGAVHRAAPAPTRVPGHLSERWRVTLPPDALRLGRPAAITAVWFVDPSDPELHKGAAWLRRATRRGVIQLVVVPLPTHAASLTAARALLGGVATLTGPARRDALWRLVSRGGGAPERLASVLGVGLPSLRRAAAKPELLVQLDGAMRLAAAVGAQPGALYLNGRRWHGGPRALGLPQAVDVLRHELRPLAQRGVPARKRYGALVAHGRVRSQAEQDLAQRRTALPYVPLLSGPRAPATRPKAREAGARGARPVDVWLRVDPRDMGARAAYFALSLLAREGRVPVRLRVAFVGGGAASPAGVALKLAAEAGRGRDCARAMITAARPVAQATLRRALSAAGVPWSHFVRAQSDPATAAWLAQVTAVARPRGTGAGEPLLFIDGRRYGGPVDENRIAAAVAHAARAKRP